MFCIAFALSACCYANINMLSKSCISIITIFHFDKSSMEPELNQRKETKAVFMLKLQGLLV